MVVNVRLEEVHFISPSRTSSDRSRTYPSKKYVHHPLQTFLLLTAKRVQIIRSVFEQRQVLRRLDGENERFRCLHHSCDRVDVKVRELAEERLVFAVIVFREPKVIILELHPSF